MDRLYFQWHITNLCNFRCRHCYQNKFDASSELDIEELRFVSDRIIEAAKRKRCKAVINITGGEPFLKKELFELLAYLDRAKEISRLIVISNGSPINHKIIEKLKEFKKLDQIKISLDGASPVVNDAIRGKGTFDKAMEALRLLKEETKFSIIVMFTVMKSNAQEIAGLYELIQKLNLDGLIIERFFPMGEGLRMRNQLLDRCDWFNLNKTLIGLTRLSYRPHDFLIQRAFWIRYGNSRVELLGASCNVGRDAFCIMPNADVLPCRRFCLKLGNLLENNLAEIADSLLLNDILNGQKKGMCAQCQIKDCRGCPALSFLLCGDYLSADFQCWYGRDIFAELEKIKN